MNQDNIDPFSRKSQTCVQTSFQNQYQVVYNRNTLLLILGILGLSLSLAIGMFQEAFYPDWDILYSIDLWSISHIMTCFSLYLLCLYISKNEIFSLLFIIIITILYEPFEQLVLFGLLGKSFIIGVIGEEVIWNSIMDIPCNLFGIIIGYLLFHTKEKCNL